MFVFSTFSTSGALEVSLPSYSSTLFYTYFLHLHNNNTLVHVSALQVAHDPLVSVL